MIKHPEPLKKTFLPQRLEEERDIMINVRFNGKTTQVPAKEIQKEDGSWVINMVISLKSGVVQ